MPLDVYPQSYGPPPNFLGILTPPAKVGGYELWLVNYKLPELEFPHLDWKKYYLLDSLLDRES